MKKILLRTTVAFIIFHSSFLIGNAQWVTIPDAAFRNYLTLTFPSCMNGTQMDTTCAAIVNATQVNCSNKGITNLTGIRYFDNLLVLNCSWNAIITLATLPNSLTELDCSLNDLTSLPVLPAGLTKMDCTNNNLPSLPTLPNSMVDLDCRANRITNLPALPNSLTTLDCSDNRLSSLPTLPGNLVTLLCYSNQITSLPALPNSLTGLHCPNNLLSSLPALPSGLLSLTFYSNLFTTFPSPLPGGLLYLFCGKNQLSSFPALPNTLRQLSCGYNQYTSLPALPGNLLFLECSHNPLGSLPVLPASISMLECEHDQLSSLPVLPPVLYDFRCGNNQLTSLPASLPSTLQEFHCDSNQITSLPALPDSLNTCYIQDNPIGCFPKVKYIRQFKFFNTAINCLPNYIDIGWSSNPPVDSIPLCDVFNTNGCDVLWNISGRTYLDSNANCLFDSGDDGLPNIKMQLWSGGSLVQQTYTTREGNYAFDVSNLGDYEVSVDTSSVPLSVLCPVNNLHYDTLTILDSLDYDKDFSLTCPQSFDLAAWSIGGERFRPANFTTVNIHAGDITNFYDVHCASGISGNVDITISGPAYYISPAIGAIAPNSVNGNVLTYNVADFGNTNFTTDFNMIVLTDTSAQIGEAVCITVNITPISGDNNPFDNTLTHCVPVRASIDPNNKEVYPVSDIDTAKEWLTYTINFQNTGTDTAIHIYVTDTLDSDLNASTFQLLSYSHQPLVQIKENAVRFNFPNINLPDSNTNEPLSHGYVQYKIKLKDNLPIGTEINNTAFIYFDFNEAVVTNTTTNTIAVISGIAASQERQDVRIYPNPASDVVTISVDENIIGSMANVTDIMGRKIAAVQLQTRNTKLETQNLTNGVYFVTVIANDGRNATKKLVIQK